MGNCLRKYDKSLITLDPKLNLQKSKTKSSSLIEKQNEDGKKHLNVDQVFEEIKDIKDLQIKGMMLLSETTGKPKDVYETLMNIAQFNYGNIKKVKHKITGRIRAERLIKKELIEVKEEETLILKELALLRTLDHPNIIKLYEFYKNENYCEQGDLFKHIKKEPNGFPEISVAHIMRQLLSVVNYCHVAHKIVNRDLRAENILVDTVEYKYINQQRTPLIFIKVFDFKSARSFKNSKKLNKKVGNPYYIAPEVLKRKYNEKCDLWSCGIIMYILLTSKPPFSGNSDKEILANVQAGHFEYFETDLANVSNECKSLLKELLKLDPDKRPSAADALSHSWFKINKIITNLDEEFVQESFNNFLKFSPELRFQQAVVAYMLHHFLDKEDTKDITSMFEMFDLDHDGRLTYEEVFEGFRKHLSIVANEKEFFKMIRKIDQDRNGFIDYEEFIRATINKHELLSDKNLLVAFSLFDQDQSQSITREELKSILGLSSKHSDKVWDHIIHEIELNKNNEVTYEEFRNIMRKLIL